jgi:hypothetical protein
MAFSWLRIFAQRLLRPVVQSRSLPQKQRRIVPYIEVLESRDVPTVFLSPDYVVHTASNGVTPLGTTGPTGYSPSEIRQAYGFNQISFNGTSGTGAGTTIAIVDAYSDPTIASDLHAFDQTFGIADPKLTVVNQSGGTSLPSADADWAGEISLDVEWAHAIAPGANILLVEAANASTSNLFAAVKYAAAQTGVVAVSMSWGGNEFSGETSYDSVFTPPASIPGVVFINSAGDSGAPAEYPSTSPNVLSVGGTTLNLTSSGSYSSESAWSGSGGGISAIESQPSYQKGIVTQSTTKRTSPDVSYDANPNTGFPVYETYGNSSSAPWLQYGGTSDAAPQWAALVAIADQGRAIDGEAALSGTTLMKDLYSLPSSDFHDVTTGTSSGSPRESATAGYDLATGLGTPIANLVVVGLVGGSATSSSTIHFSISGASTATAGGSYSFTVTALNANNQVDTAYTGTVKFASSDPSAVLPANYTFKASDAGTHTFTVTFKTAGTQSLTVTDTSNASSTGSETGITVFPGATTELVYLQQPSSGLVGNSINPAVKVEEVDQFGNVVTTDYSTKITLSLGSNSGGATLSGGGTVTVINGVATFSDLTVSAAGTGYTLVASNGSLTATSSAFNITTSTANVIENFQNGLGAYYYVGNSYPFVGTTSSAAHPGTATEGLLDEGDGNWYFREDSGAVVTPGSTISAWINFSGTADGRAYFGFGTTGSGLDSVVLAPNSGQLLIQNNAGFNSYTNLAAVNQTYAANTWYLVQIQWGTSGTVTANLYASNGTTLLNSITAATGDITAGTFAFRAIGSTKYFSTVTDTPGVNNNATLKSSTGSVSSTSSGSTSTTSGCSSQTTGTGTGSSGQASGSYWMSITSPTTTKSENPRLGGIPWFGAGGYDPFVEGWSVWVE